MNLKRKNIYEKQDDKFILQEYYNYKYNKLGFIVEETNKIRINDRYVNFHLLYYEYQGNILIKEIYNFDYNYDNDVVVEYLENYYKKGEKRKTKEIDLLPQTDYPKDYTKEEIEGKNILFYLEDEKDEYAIKLKNLFLEKKKLYDKKSS